MTYKLFLIADLLIPKINTGGNNIYFVAEDIIWEAQ